jgi:hypothetical protein
MPLPIEGGLGEATDWDAKDSSVARSGDLGIQENLDLDGMAGGLKIAHLDCSLCDADDLPF